MVKIISFTVESFKHKITSKGSKNDNIGFTIIVIIFKKYEPVARGKNKKSGTRRYILIPVMLRFRTL